MFFFREGRDLICQRATCIWHDLNVYLLFYWRAAPQQTNGKGRVLGPVLSDDNPPESSDSSSERPCYLTYISQNPELQSDCGQIRSCWEKGTPIWTCFLLAVIFICYCLSFNTVVTWLLISPSRLAGNHWSDCGSCCYSPRVCSCSQKKEVRLLFIFILH